MSAAVISLYDYKQFVLLLENKAKPLSNLEVYLTKMARGLEDKIFFLNEIDPDCIVDFGCADGFILKQIHLFHPDIKLIGYDYDQVMLDKISDSENILFTNNWEEIKNEIYKYKKPTILLSSVIHEVYSYDNPNKFWNIVFNSGFKYVAIRDMMYSDRFKNFTSNEINNIRINSNESQLKEFEDRWGGISDSYVNAIHWLLKYPYIDNWSRELNENYLPLSIEKLKQLIPLNYNIKFEDFYILGHVQRKVKREMGVDITQPTHIKLILSNNI